MRFRDGCLQSIDIVQDGFVGSLTQRSSKALIILRHLDHATQRTLMVESCLR